MTHFIFFCYYWDHILYKTMKIMQIFGVFFKELFYRYFILIKIFKILNIFSISEIIKNTLFYYFLIINDTYFHHINDSSSPVFQHKYIARHLVFIVHGNLCCNKAISTMFYIFINFFYLMSKSSLFAKFPHKAFIPKI